MGGAPCTTMPRCSRPPDTHGSTYLGQFPGGTILITYIHQFIKTLRRYHYLPRTARAVPNAQTVHTIFVKKVILTHYRSVLMNFGSWELSSDGHETWRPMEPFLGTLHLTTEPRTLRPVANQWRRHYDVPPISSTDTSQTVDPVLPHPEHSNISFGQRGFRYSQSYFDPTLWSVWTCATCIKL